jgi:hypothetical protein
LKSVPLANFLAMEFEGSPPGIILRSIDFQTRVAAVSARQSEIAEQPWDALIEHGAIVAAGLVAER